ncbi:hypothetical protein CR513_14832, partial [Mucuna pruriens]
MTSRMKIDVHVEILSMEFGNTFMKFNIFKALKHLAEDHSIFSIGNIEGLIEEYAMSTGSANLAAKADSKMLSHILPFSYFEDFISDIIYYRIDKVLETSQYAEFSIVDTSKLRVIGAATLIEIKFDFEIKFQKANWSEFDSKGKKKSETDSNIQELAETKSINSKGAEIVSNNQPEARSNSSQMESQSSSTPDNRVHSVGQPTPSIEEKEISPQPLNTKLKPLPKHLKYAFFGDHQQFSVIIANNLNREQEEKLLGVLKKHKKAIGWALTELPRINPSICMHKILLEEDAHPIRKQ